MNTCALRLSSASAPCLASLADRPPLVGRFPGRGRTPNLLEECATDMAKVKSGALARAIAAGDEDIRAIVEQAAFWLGRGVAATVNLLAPEMVVLGGGMVGAMEDLFVTEVTRSANESVMSAYRDRFEVGAADLQDDATVLGAAAYARRRILADQV